MFIQKMKHIICSHASFFKICGISNNQLVYVKALSPLALHGRVLDCPASDSASFDTSMVCLHHCQEMFLCVNISKPERLIKKNTSMFRSFLLKTCNHILGIIGEQVFELQSGG